MASKTLFVFIIAVIAAVHAVHDSLNFVIHSGTKSCFYEHFEASAEARTIDAFVQAGSGAYLEVYGPLSLEEIRAESFNNPAIVLDRIDASKESLSETQSFTRDFMPTLEGVYGICIDNSRSSFLDNVVQLDVRKGPKEIHYELGAPQGGAEKGAVTTTSTGGAGGNDEVIKALDSITRIRKGLVAIQIQQLRDRRRLNLYNETNKSNRNEMLIGALAETAVFVLAAIFQIYFVRRWFAKRENAIRHNSNPMGASKLSA